MNSDIHRTWPGRMCQWGARALAVDYGKTWRQILQFYYPDADWGDAPGPGPPPPPPEGDIGEWLLEDLDKHLPPWKEWVSYNPHTALTQAARDAEPPLGLAISGELRKQRDSKVIVCQFFWTGLAWCPEKEYDNIRIVRY